MVDVSKMNGMLSEFFNPNSPLPVEETLAKLREDSMDMFKLSMGQTKAGLDRVLNSYYVMLEFQSQELELLKTLETYIRRGKLEPDILNRIMGDLDLLRASVMEKAKAFAVSAQAKGS
jgi:hypothetical protein